MAITKNQSGTYAAVDIHYNRPACAPHQNVINYLDHLHIMVIHKSLTAYLGCGYSRVLVGPLGNDEMSDFLSVTPQNKYEIAYTMYLKKTNTTADANSVMLDDMYCIGTYQGSEKMSNYLVFCDEWPQDADVRETLLSFKIPVGM